MSSPEMQNVRDCLRLVKFSHSVFALPFALQGAWLASGGMPELRVLALIIACAVAARTAAMAFNRYVDRAIDGANPRTSSRELPAGRMRPRAVLILIAIASAAFIGAAFALNALAGWLALPVLLVLFSYSYFKRFTWLSHGMLGLSLALAPCGAWIAVRGDLSGDLAPIAWLAGAVWSWVAGFDLIYACQDAQFDASFGLHSLPARFGVARALSCSSVLHALTIACLVMVGSSAQLSFIYWASVVLAAGLLVFEHRLVSPRDLSRIDAAFFTVNGWIGVGLFIGLALDRGLLSGGA